MRFRAAVLVEQRAPLALEELEVPALKYGQVLVKVICSGICGSQIGEIDGVKGPDTHLPHLLGHEGTGEVLEVGEAVRHVAVGNRVVMHWRRGAGIESAPPVYLSSKGRRVNAGWVTTFNELAVLSENRVTAIAHDFDPEVGALMGCAVTTAFGAINNNCGVRIGESVVVWGVGGVGLNIVQAASMVSAYPIVAIDLFDIKLHLAKKQGATHLINASRTDAEQASRMVVGDAGADVVIETTGNVEAIEAAYRLTRSTGRAVLVGVPPVGEKARFDTLPLHFHKTMTGSHGGESQPHVDIPRYVRLCEAGKLQLKHLVTARCGLEQINDALSAMRRGEIAGRCMVLM